jgi:hypothetical protein
VIWSDFLLEDVRTIGELRQSLADAFGLAIEEVCVVNSAAELPASGVAIACEQRIRSGQFKWHLTLYSFSPRTWSSEYEITQSLSRSLKTRCLLADGALNPFTMVLVTAIGTESVSLDVDKLDRFDEYWLE